MSLLDPRAALLRYAGITMVIAAGLRASYAAFFETQHIATAPHWAAQWAVGYVVFVVAYALMPTDSFATMTRGQAWSAAVQAIAGIYLVWLYPSFVVVCLLVLVAWQFALLLDLRGRPACLRSADCCTGTDQMHRSNRGFLRAHHRKLRRISAPPRQPAGNTATHDF